MLMLLRLLLLWVHVSQIEGQLIHLFDRIYIRLPPNAPTDLYKLFIKIVLDIGSMIYYNKSTYQWRQQMSKEFTTTATVDSYIQKQFTETVSVDSYLTGSITETFTVDAILSYRDIQFSTSCLSPSFGYAYSKSE